ncbi:MAG: nucleotidyltransferase domain-containing protein [Syntrophomonas sp.]
MVDYQEIQSIKEQVIRLFKPEKILMFGSQAKGSARQQSDIDLCIILNTDNKRALLADMYLQIDSKRPLDLILYTPQEWSQVVGESGTFAYMIAEKGEEIYGR